MDPIVAAAAGLFLVAAALADLRARTISNRLNITAAAVAFALQFVTNGTAGLLTAALGLGVGFAVLLAPFACGLLGGGDVKFAAAVGAFLGWRILLVGLASGIIIGGVVGVISLVSQGRMSVAMKNLWGDLYSLSSGVKPDTLKQTAAVHTIPYGVMLAIGFAGAIVAHTWRLV